MSQERVIYPTNEDVNKLLGENPMTRLQLNVITLTRELELADAEIASLKVALAMNPCTCNKEQNPE